MVVLEYRCRQRGGRLRDSPQGQLEEVDPPVESHWQRCRRGRQAVMQLVMICLAVLETVMLGLESPVSIVYVCEKKRAGRRMMKDDAGGQYATGAVVWTDHQVRIPPTYRRGLNLQLQSVPERSGASSVDAVAA